MSSSIKLYQTVSDTVRLITARLGAGYGGHLRPRKYRKEKLELLRELVAERDLRYATCKEGFINLDTADNCCDMNFFKSPYIIRPTLRELKELEIRMHTSDVDFLFKELSKYEGILTGRKLSGYPRLLRKPLKRHENVL